MNDKKIAFIICTNNELLLNECLTYISVLKIPEDYEIDILTITDASCMTSGYNEGMHSTDAKYKIYMHQDVFIINPNFIYDVLEIFNSNSSIGMVGMVGYKCVSLTGAMWHEKRFGTSKLYGTKRDYPSSHYSSDDINNYTYSLKNDGFTDVALIDGLMMITSVDIPWDDTLLKDWDFYDAFHCISFLEKNLKIVVPNQQIPWGIHDDGRILSMWNYNKYRKLFMQKHSNYLGLNSDEIRALN